MRRFAAFLGLVAGFALIGSPTYSACDAITVQNHTVQQHTDSESLINGRVTGTAVNQSTNSIQAVAISFRLRNDSGDTAGWATSYAEDVEPEQPFDIDAPIYAPNVVEALLDDVTCFRKDTEEDESTNTREDHGRSIPGNNS